jgi:hypothetical protein
MNDTTKVMPFQPTTTTSSNKLFCDSYKQLTTTDSNKTSNPLLLNPTLGMETIVFND